MNKLIFPLVAFAAVVFSSGVFAQNSQITIGQQSGQQGDQLSIPVTLENNHDMADFQIDVVYDSDELTLRSGGASCGFIDIGNDLGSNHSAVCSEQDATTLRIGVVPVPGPPQAIPDGELMSIRINIDGTADPGTYTLEATNASAGDTDASDITGSTSFNNGSVTVLAGPPETSFDPDSGTTINFGGVEVGQSSDRDVEVCNVGSPGSIIDNISASASGTGFSADDSACTGQSLEGPSDCCDVVVTFAPTSGGGTGFSGSLNISTSDENGSWTLAGTGQDGPAAALSISDTAHDFGGVDPGDSDDFTFVIENTGATGSEARIDSIVVAGNGFSHAGGSCSVGTELDDGQDCTVVVEFAPDSAGPFSGSLTVGGSDQINETALPDVAASLEGFGNGAIFSSSPAPGNVNLGIAGPAGELDIDVIVSNSGNINLTVDCTVDSNDGDVFAFDPLSFSVAPDESESFNVHCDLPDLDTYSATLSCDTNDADNAEVSYTFTCTGLEPLPVPAMQTWGLILLMLTMLAVGGFSMRYFRIG